MEKEIWKDIIGYENYQVSNYGNVKSLNYNRTGEEKILKQEKDTQGYCRVGLCVKGKMKHYRVHRLVASAFIPNTNNYCVVNHRDENKQNNHISNLEWVTQKYNINFGTRNEKCSKAHSKPILQFNREGTKIIGKFNSAKQASNELKINRGHICECCKGKLKTAKGYKWMYLQDYANRMEKLYNLTLKKVS